MTMAKLIYVIGASGVGKDSLLSYARGYLPKTAPVIFAHRYITRPADAGGENHVSLSEAEFKQRQSSNCFALDWYSHETYYGIGIEIEQWLTHGSTVVLNGSRAYLDEAIKRYPVIVPVLIEADTSVLEKRLQLRGRENMAQVKARLTLADKLNKQMTHPNLIRIQNNASLEAAGQQLISIILEECERCS